MNESAEQLRKKIKHLLAEQHLPGHQGIMKDFDEFLEQYYSRIKELEESEEKFKNLVQKSTDAIIILNPAGSVLEWNKGCELVFGIPREMAFSQKIWSLAAKFIVPDYVDSERNIFRQQSMEQAFLTGQAPWIKHTNEMVIVDEEGNNKTIQSIAFPVKSAQGYLLGIISRDISEVKDTEKMLKIARDKAEEASQAKSRFLANISHEIRTPLNVILGFSGIMKELPAGSEKFGELLSGIERSSKALMSLINDILDLSRIEAGKMAINPVPLNLRQLVHDVQQVFALKANSKGVDLNLEISPCLPHLIKMDETRIRQVLFNLVGNAVKFTAHGAVSIRVEAKNTIRKSGNTNICITVTDTGIGIEPHETESIFDPFFQNVVPGIIKQEGTGLGLSISRRFVEMMQGEIKVESEPGQGTTFKIFIPGVQVLEYKSRKGKLRILENQGEPDTIGIRPMADNDQLVANLFSEIVQRTGSLKQAKVFLSREIWVEFDKVADILGFDEVLVFSEALSDVASKKQLPALKAFSEKLEQQARAFNVIEINQMLSAMEKLRG